MDFFARSLQMVKPNDDTGVAPPASEATGWTNRTPAGTNLTLEFGASGHPLVHPSEPNRMFIGYDQDGIYESLDYGDTWEKVSPVDSIVGEGAIWFLAISPDGATMVAGHGHDSTNARHHKIIISKDLGRTWIEGSGDLLFQPYDCKFDRTNSSRAIFTSHVVDDGNVYLSENMHLTDGGITVTSIGDTGGGNSGYAFFGLMPNTVIWVDEDDDGGVGATKRNTYNSTAATFGKTAIGGTFNNFPAPDTKSVSRFTLPTTGNISKLTIYFRGTAVAHDGGLARGVIYDTAGNLVGTTQEVTVPDGVDGWIDFPFASAVTLAAADYDLGVISGNRLHGAMDTAGTNKFNNDTYSDGPTDPFGSSTSSTQEKSIYATYTTPTWSGWSNVAELGHFHGSFDPYADLDNDLIYLPSASGIHVSDDDGLTWDVLLGSTNLASVIRHGDIIIAGLSYALGPGPTFGPNIQLSINGGVSFTTQANPTGMGNGPRAWAKTINAAGQLVLVCNCWCFGTFRLVIDI